MIYKCNAHVCGRCFNDRIEGWDTEKKSCGSLKVIGWSFSFDSLWLSCDKFIVIPNENIID